MGASDPLFLPSQAKAVRVLPRPLRRSRASSPKGRAADTPGNFTGQPGTVPPPLKPSPTGGRWRVAPDEGQHQLPRRGSLKPIAKVLGIMRRLSAVLLALPLRKDFPRSGGRCRAATKGGIWQARQGLAERAHAVSPIAKASGVKSKFPAAPEAPSPREPAKPQGFD